MNIPRAIKSARDRAELSQVALAKKLSVSPSTVAGWELGTHAPRMAMLPKIAKALGRTLGELIEAAA